MAALQFQLRFTSVFRACLIAFCFSFSCGDLFAANDKSDTRTKYQLEQIKQQIDNLKKRLKKNRRRYGTAAENLKKTEKQINSAAKILRATRRQVKRQKAELKEKRSDELRLVKEKEQHQRLLADQLRSAYSSGKQEYLKLLLNQEEPAKLGRIITYYEYLNNARTLSIRALGETIIQLTAIQDQIQQKLKQLVVLEKSQQAEQKRLVSLKSTRKKEVQRLAKSISSQDKRLLSLRENEEELESLLRQMQKALAEIIEQQDLDGLRPVKGKMSWPVRGKIVQNYGERIHQGIRSNGIRINTKEGQEVSAVHHGQVVFSDWLRGFGLLAIVDHGKGYMSLYGNNQSLFKEVGDWVEAGELISTAGQSGGQRAPGLYFEIRHQGKAQNPMRWIKR